MLSVSLIGRIRASILQISAETTWKAAQVFLFNMSLKTAYCQFGLFKAREAQDQNIPAK